MTKRTRRNHGAVFETEVAMEAIKEEQTLVELAQRFQVRSRKPISPLTIFIYNLEVIIKI